MNSKPLRPLSACAVLAVLLPASLLAQEAHHAESPSVASSTLTIQGLDGKSIVLTTDDFKTLPHRDYTVLNGHTHLSETYSGVPLIALLAKVGVPQGADVKGPLLMIGVVAQGTDGYKVLYSIAEIDPAAHAGDVIVSDSMNGKSLGNAGGFKLVSSEDKRPARWVRNLKAVSVQMIKP